MKNLIFIILITLYITSLISCSMAKHDAPGINHIYDENIGYTNPVIKGFFPDPSVCRVGDDYYLVTSSFEYFPGVPVFHSKDLVNWDQIGNVLYRKSQLNLDSVNTSGGIFAPVIRYHEGKFYMITTHMHGGNNFFVTAEDPAGPWSEPVWLEPRCIDPSLFFDEDGKVYFTGTSPWIENSESGIYQAEINIETGELLSPYTKIWNGTGGRYPEGPHLYKIGDMYYLLISEGGTEAGHMVTMARADNPWGPFIPCPFNPILTNRDDAPNIVQNTGHADIVQDPEGKWWMVHLAVRSVNKFHHLGRETFLLPLDWNEDGWPVINKTGRADLEIYTQAPDEQKNVRHYGKYDFNEKSLGYEWNYLRNPHIENYSVDEMRGMLQLKTSLVSLDDKSSPTFVGIRQKDFDIEVSTRMIFKPAFEGEEAGITAFMNNEHYFSVSMVRSSKGNFIRATAKTGKLKHTIAEVAVKQEEVYLKISADKFIYRFLWSEDGEIWQTLGENYAKYISTEVADGFTGVYLAMYAESNSKQSGSIASFDWFNYEHE